MRKQTIYMTVIGLVVFVVAAMCWSQSAVNSYQMKKLAYGSEIDAKIAFYEKRLYLINSENPVLADIGKVAAQKIHFLKSYKAKLVEEMVAANVPLRKSKMKLFIFKKMRNLDDTTIGYVTK